MKHYYLCIDEHIIDVFTDKREAVINMCEQQYLLDMMKIDAVATLI